jgi:hypothetical protein
MADKEKEDDITVNIDDSDTIAVNVDDNPELAATTPKEVVKEAKTPKEPKAKRVDPDDQVVVKPAGPTPEEALAQAQTFAKQQEDARRAAEATAASERVLREQAQRDAQQALQTAEQHRERADSSELAIIENGIAAAERELESHENEYTRAAEAGEFAKMAKIQTKLSKAAAALDRLQSEKSTLELNARRTPTTEGRVVDTQPSQSSPVDQYLSQFAPAAQTWLRQHPDCMPSQYGGDSTKNAKMLAGHYAAVAKNIGLNTPEYFKEIEEHISPAQQVQSKAAEIQEAVVEPKTAKHVQPTAPVTRDAPSTPGTPRNVREVRLTKEQQEMAKVSFPHLPDAQAFGQYARNLIELEAEGKIGRLTH